MSRRALATAVVALAALPAAAQGQADPPALLHQNGVTCWTHKHDPHPITIDVSGLPLDFRTAVITAAEEWNAVALLDWGISFVSSGADVDASIDNSIWTNYSFSGQFLADTNCHWTHAVLKFADIAPANANAIGQLQTACHELGHVLGAGHGGNGCIGRGYPGAPSSDLDAVPYVPGTNTPALLRSAYSASH